MRLDILEGGYAKSRSGKKRGPFTRVECNAYVDRSGFYYLDDSGKSFYSDGRTKQDGIDRPEDLIAEWTEGPVFTVGAKVRRIASPHSFVPIGYETDIKGIEGNTLSYRGADGDLMHSPVEHWELVERTDGPIRTVTRTVTEIVPGLYGIVKVGPVINGLLTVELACSTTGFTRSVEELKAAAAVLLELAGALDNE